MSIILVGFVLFSYLLGRLGMPLEIRFLNQAGHLRQNHEGNKIPISAGLIFFPVTVIVWISVSYWEKNLIIEMLFFSFGAMAVVLSALTDDLWGNHEVKGLKGHFKKLSQGVLTTGALKALTGLGAGLFIAYIFNSRYIFLSALLVALSINLVNLLDLRPGRAGKFFFIVALLLLIFDGDLASLIIAPAFGVLLAYLPFDLLGKVMLGDVGSNYLGFLIGAALIVSLPYSWQLFLLLVLLYLHWYTEHYSLNKLIAAKPLLKRIDNWGREKKSIHKKGKEVSDD